MSDGYTERTVRVLANIRASATHCADSSKPSHRCQYYALLSGDAHDCAAFLGVMKADERGRPLRLQDCIDSEEAPF